MSGATVHSTNLKQSFENILMHLINVKFKRKNTDFIYFLYIILYVCFLMLFSSSFLAQERNWNSRKWTKEAMKTERSVKILYQLNYKFTHTKLNVKRFMKSRRYTVDSCTIFLYVIRMIVVFTFICIVQKVRKLYENQRSLYSGGIS